jgi:phytoene/squalene synthetase
MAKFQKGQSGNPGGRPKIVGEVQDLARQHSAQAIETLAAIMKDEKAPPAARALASNSILDRAYGKPPQTLNANVASRPVREMSDAELMAIAGSESEAVPTEH